MYWTKEKPVKDGFYWVEFVVQWTREYTVVEIRQGLVYYTGVEKPNSLNAITTSNYWYGPITPPPRESSES